MPSQSRPLLYIDQNVLGYQTEGCVSLPVRDDAAWAYSTEHFNEMARGDDPDRFLNTLRDLNAARVEWHIEKDQYTATYDEDPHQAFSNHREAHEDIPDPSQHFHAFMAWVNGGGSDDRLKTIPDELSQYLTDLNAQYGIGDRSSELTEMGLDATINKMISQGNDIEKHRKKLGIGSGRAGDVPLKTALHDIWAYIKKRDNTPDDFSIERCFGFEIMGQDGKWHRQSHHIGIVACCAALDIYGFRVESKKAKRESKLPNVLSDAQHIAYAAACQALITADENLADRATAIYAHLGIQTQVARMTFNEVE